MKLTFHKDGLQIQQLEWKSCSKINTKQIFKKISKDIETIPSNGISLEDLGEAIW
jgi:hypothetical protein